MTKRKWRSDAPRLLNTRPIYTKDWPRLIQKMKDDGLVAVILSDGVKWYHGAYEIKPPAIRFVWELTTSQYRRLVDYILVNDPFYPTPTILNGEG